MNIELHTKGKKTKIAWTPVLTVVFLIFCAGFASCVWSRYRASLPSQPAESSWEKRDYTPPEVAHPSYLGSDEPNPPKPV